MKGFSITWDFYYTSMHIQTPNHLFSHRCSLSRFCITHLCFSVCKENMWCRSCSSDVFTYSLIAGLNSARFCSESTDGGSRKHQDSLSATTGGFYILFLRLLSLLTGEKCSAAPTGKAGEPEAEHRVHVWPWPFHQTATEVWGSRGHQPEPGQGGICDHGYQRAFPDTQHTEVLQLVTWS